MMQHTAIKTLADLPPLRGLPLLDNAGDASFARLVRAARSRRVPRGERLIMEGDVASNLYILLDGAIALTATWEGREATLALASPPALLGLTSVVLEAPAKMSARMIETGQVLEAPGRDVREAMRKDAALACAIAERIAAGSDDMIATWTSTRLQTSLERLALFLQGEALRQRSSTITLPCRKRVLASLLGMTPENLSRAFATLASQGVAVDGRRVTLAEPRPATSTVVAR